MKRDAATERQVRAADPAASTWVTANAGSGKTRVLTNRVARLLLAGTSPQRILCLTYTKAAAAEMQNRLFGSLGGWAMLPDDALRQELARLGEDGPLDPHRLAAARRLFAQAIETPGGLRIQTIHSFCAALLRRFPLEAGVSPRFQEMDDRTGALLRGSIVEAMAGGEAPEAVAAVARHYRGEDFAGLADAVAAARADFDPARDEAAIRAALGADATATIESLAADIIGPDGRAVIAALVPLLAAGSTNDARIAPRLAAMPDGAAALDVLEDILLYGEKAKAGPFTAKIGAFPTAETRKRVGAALESLLDPLYALMRRVEHGRPRRHALATAERTVALHRFAAAFLPRYAAAKAARGWLDFDDLILRTRALLADPGVAQWVLWRLDGGIDHILVDEAQDTGPGQWEVIERLAAEIVAGEGARSGRTVFVVGDRKQSIYSFQGADLDAFDATGARFAAQLAGGPGLARVELEYSFRSSPAVLRAVDATFDDAAGRGIGGAMRHIAFHADMPGRVDLWPVVPKAEKPAAGAWFDPVDLPRPDDPAVVLAETIAATIAGWLAAGVQVPGKKGPRLLTPGDILILVQRRSALFPEIIRACKARGLPMAGADRLKLGAELAVKDLAALLAFIELPDDDLSLAAALRSPLFGWSEDDLFRIAHGRKGTLWDAVRASGRAETLAILDDLRAQADYLRPYELVDRILTRHDGRRRLIARLGPEAEDGIDQFLAQALAYERLSVPSLTGFLVWLETDEVEVRRQVDAASNRIRVMTVHGAKGLEAPVVILPDTADRRPRDRDTVMRLPSGLPVWRPPADAIPPAVAEARAAAQAAWEAEHKRLLYVAMTRAESWLIVAGAGDGEGANAWHDRVRMGLEAAGAVSADMPTGPGLRLSHGDWPEDAPGAVPDTAPEPSAADPGPPPPPAPARRTRTPSDLGGAKALPGAGDETEAALRRGTALHRLLELLPALPPEERPTAAARLLAATGETPDLLAEAERLITDPALAPLFGPQAMAEATLATDMGGDRWFGTIDRLLVESDRVLAVDFKSNRTIPDRAEDVPEGILRQMGAYAAMLETVYPARRVETAILWTAAGRLMPLPDALIRAALLRAGSA
jgi:ATP-dependent helicase/nuclease subunit A